MSIWMFWKLFGEVCLYFSAVSALPTLFTHNFSFLWPPLLCGAAATLAAVLGNGRRPGLRFFTLVIPLGMLTLAGNTMELFLLLPPMLYTAAVVLRGEFMLEYLSYREFFRKTMIVWVGFLALICIAFAVEDISRPWNMTLSFEGPVRWGAFYILSGIVLLRQLRLGCDSENKDRRLDGIQTAIMLGGTGAAVAAIVAAERFLKENAAAAMDLLGKAFAYIFSLPITIVVWFVSMLIDDMKPYFEDQQATESTTEATEYIVNIVPAESQPVTETVEQTADSFPWWLVVLILVVLTALLMLALKLLREKSSGAASQTIIDIISRPERRKKENKTTNRAKVRRFYREYLKLERRKGTQLRTNQTSGDILREGSGDLDREAAARLRQVYLSARYDENGEVTQSQLDDARAALKKIQDT